MAAPATRAVTLAVAVAVAVAAFLPGRASAGVLEIRDGYFWDPDERAYFLPRGISYQTWNPPVFANQSFEQVEYDLREFARMRANSVRAEFVWSQVETSPGVFDWEKPDFLIAKAEELGLKLFLIIGFQYPPPWFPDEWYATNDRGTQSDVLNYQDPRAQDAYTNFIGEVAARYRDSEAVAAWILGNEFAFFDLWEDPDLYPARRFLGYDAVSLESFRNFLESFHGGDIGALNAKWGTGFAGFGEVTMPEKYPADRHEPGYHDLIKWRQQSIGDFIARGAVAARQADPNHLITYSMVGGIFNGSDTNNTCEDGQAIVAACAAAGEPLDFWSINNYAWATEGSELRSGDYGVAKYQELLGLPVMLSETGHTSTENLLEGADVRQPDAVPATLWEALLSGAIGVHLFHWSDRDQFLGGFFIREAGFGIVSQKRLPKPSVFENTEAMFARMAEIDIGNLLGGSTGPPADVLFYWSDASQMGWPRANQENAMVWGALKRAGLQPGLLEDAAFAARDFGTARSIIVSRGYQLEPADLDRLQSDVLDRGIHLHANADLPGRFNTYHSPNPNWAAAMSSLFGLDVSAASPAWDAGAVGGDTYRGIVLQGDQPLGALTADYHQPLATWKIWEGLGTLSGTTVLRHDGLEAGAPGTPALHLKDHGTARAAVNTFALGDTFQSGGGGRAAELWDYRSDLVGAVHREYFGIEPAIEIEGSGAAYVVPDYRVCRNGSHLVSLLNGHTEPAVVTVASPTLLPGRTVEKLTSGEILALQPDGTLDLTLPGDAYVLLHVYDEGGANSGSLANPGESKVWFEGAPTTVLPDPDGVEVTVRFDTRGTLLQLAGTFEQVDADGTVLTRGRSTPVPVTGPGGGTRTLLIPVPDADAGDPSYSSSRRGGQFRLAAVLTDRGAPVSTASVPVRFTPGVYPVAPPPEAAPGGSYAVEVAWEELPSYEPDDVGTPLGRTALWDSPNATRSHYNIVLELLEGDSVAASGTTVTRAETGSHVFEIDAPAGAAGPLAWRVRAEPAPGASADVFESMEGRETGAAVIWPPPDDPPPPRDVDLIDPWALGTYAHLGDPGRIYQNHGVHLVGSHGSQSIFTVTANPADVGDFSGFFVFLPFEEPRAFPFDQAGRAAFRFSADFMEATGRPAVIELQLKDTEDRIARSAKTYEPGEGGWDTVSATLDTFEPESPTFDWSQVKHILVVVAMLESGDDVQYVSSIDNIVLDGPETVVAGGETVVAYHSRDDSLPDRDGDGVPDAHETGSGAFASPTDTGTDPDNADSDGDGQPDGLEVAAGTDPNSNGDRFEIERVERDPAGGSATIVFFARPGHRYGVEARTRRSPAEEPAFRLVPGSADISVDTPGLTAVDVTLPPGSEATLLRLVAERGPVPPAP